MYFMLHTSITFRSLDSKKLQRLWSSSKMIKAWFRTKNSTLIKFLDIRAPCIPSTFSNSCIVEREYLHIEFVLRHNHSLIRWVLIQSCSAEAKKFTNYVFCHPQFSGVIQNIANRCVINKKNQFLLYKIDYFDNNRHKQTGVKMAQRFSIFWITPLNCGWQNT